jgi:hypothetical protein
MGNCRRPARQSAFEGEPSSAFRPPGRLAAHFCRWADPAFTLSNASRKPRGIEARSKAPPNREGSGRRCRRTTNRRRLNTIFSMAGSDDALSTVVPYLPWTSAWTRPRLAWLCLEPVPSPAVRRQQGKKARRTIYFLEICRAVSSACVFNHTRRERSSQRHQIIYRPVPRRLPMRRGPGHA